MKVYGVEWTPTGTEVSKFVDSNLFATGEEAITYANLQGCEPEMTDWEFEVVEFDMDLVEVLRKHKDEKEMVVMDYEGNTGKITEVESDEEHPEIAVLHINL